MSNAQDYLVMAGAQISEMAKQNAELLAALENAVAAAQANAGQLHYDDVQTMRAAIARAKGAL